MNIAGSVFSYAVFLTAMPQAICDGEICKSSQEFSTTTCGVILGYLVSIQTSYTNVL
jgi:hypothetical protein